MTPIFIVFIIFYMDDAASKLLGPILDAIQGEGIDAKYLARKLKEELEAEEVKVFNGQDGITYSAPLVAWRVRQEARKDAHKLLGQYPSEKVDHSVNIVNPMSIAVQVFHAHKSAEASSSSASPPSPGADVPGDIPENE